MMSPAFDVDVVQGNHRSYCQGHKSTELVIHCLIFYMVRDHFYGIHVNSRMTQAAFFSVLHQGADSVNNCPVLAIDFPTDGVGPKLLAMEFQSKSSKEGLDRWLFGGLCSFWFFFADSTYTLSNFQAVIEKGGHLYFYFSFITAEH